MMKKLFWIVLLANMLLFVAVQRDWLEWGELAPQAQPALHADQISLLDARQAAVAVTLASSVPGGSALGISAPDASSSVASAPSAIVPPLAASAVVAKPGTLTCWEWGDFSGADLARAQTALSALQLGDKLTQHQIEHDTGYWVYFPPLKNKAAINQKIKELKARGINEYFVVQNAGPWQNAISLGVFKTQEAAQLFLDKMRSKKVRSAQIGQRASKFSVTLFRLREIGILTEVKLSALQKDFAGSEFKQVACAQSGAPSAH